MSEVFNMVGGGGGIPFGEAQEVFDFAGMIPDELSWVCTAEAAE